MNKQEGTPVLLRNMEVTIADSKVINDQEKNKIFFELANTTRNQICPVRDIISRISDKWSILAIYGLGGYGKLRFNELKHKIGDISQRMLTVTLRNLEADGLITRTIYPEVPPRVEYELTELGLSLMKQLHVLAEWANLHGEEIIYYRQKALKSP